MMKMFEVNIYLETSLKGPGTRKGWYAAVLEFIKNGKAITREDFVLEKETTYHKSVLCALAKSLKRLNASCHLNIYTDSIFVKNSVENNLSTWKANGYLNIKAEPIKNQEEWREVGRLLSGHNVKFRITKRHSYSVWMREKAKNLENTECEDH